MIMYTQADVIFSVEIDRIVNFTCDSSGDSGIVTHADESGLTVRLVDGLSHFSWDESFTVEIDNTRQSFNA